MCFHFVTKLVLVLYGKMMNRSIDESYVNVDGTTFIGYGLEFVFYWDRQVVAHNSRPILWLIWIIQLRFYNMINDICTLIKIWI